MARVTSALFVSALMRRIMAAGGFATVVRKGANEAGAIFISQRERNGSIKLYAPAPQTNYQADQNGDRQFHLVEHVLSDEALAAFQIAESRFDPDFWIVEIELGSDFPELFQVTKP